MIIAQIEGGLGSQMFGYAAARRLAVRHNDEVFIDARNYRTYKKFQLELHHLDVDATLLQDYEADGICGPQNQNIRVVQNRHTHVDQEILNLPKQDVLMVGNYWSEDYFFDITDLIRKEFKRTSESSAYALELGDQINRLAKDGSSPIAVHVRRGDYVTEAHTNAFHGLATREYYENAFSLMRRIVKNPSFVFFSNDSAWVEENYGNVATLIAAPPEDAEPIDDMMLMAQCHHHVMANSGYSWWGAWLSEHADKVVIGPRPFLTDRGFNTEDYLLRDWISLASIARPGSN